ncbi:MAG: enoyl-CoA hydratase/isomerase family protein [Acidobacteriota bacterium]|nr:enoyl-CoA hydratase/isomerase family protein [Blastocatellia bacterium]MDW8413427.1 enoyl-CoA hydratase/isomerase family protein [Acidobacteriota bacterium]
MYDEAVVEKYESIQFTIADRIGYIVFNRPPLNIFTISMMKEINAALNAMSRNMSVSCIVFAAIAGSKAFSAGVSVEEHRPETVYQMLDSFHSIFRTLYAYSKPIIAVVDGPALGGGCELVAFCDVVIATDRAKFGQPEIRLGVFPPMGSIILPRVIGLKRATELMYTGETIDALEAQSLGLVNVIVEVENLQERVQEILSRFSRESAVALEATRRAILTAYYPDFNELLSRVEDQYLLQLMNCQDPIEGINAFLEKRPPVWKHK